VGIVGCGAIGSRVGRICSRGFGSRVLYNDIRDVGPLDFDAEAVSKERLWAESDVVSLHVPLTPATRGLVGATVLSQMRPGALLINTCRGEAVQTEALVEALQSGRLGGAGLDVTHPEPLPPGHPLFQLSRCVLTPHVAARTYTGLRNMFGVVGLIIEALKIPRPAPRSVAPGYGP
jgi:glyoxylate reductase